MKGGLTKVRGAGGDRERADDSSHRKRDPQAAGTERLMAERVDEDLTDLLFGEPVEPLPRDR